jgi:hypothetical protein
VTAVDLHRRDGVLLMRHVLRRVKPAVRTREEQELQSCHGVDQHASCSVQMTRNLGQVSTGVAARALLVQRDGLQQLPWEMTVQSPVPGNSPRVTWARGTVPHSDQPREQQVSIVWC